MRSDICMILENYFYNGQFYKCFSEATKQDDEVAKKFLGLFENYQYDKLPRYTKTDDEQSVERADESYAELDELQRIRAIRDEVAFGEAIKQLESDAKLADDERKAASFFIQGHLFLLAHHYDESIHCFLQAVKYNPNKALYHGFAAQTMHRFNWSPFEVMAYLEQAIDLDPHNARWLWNKGLVLTQLYKDLQQEPFLEQALITLEEALAACREEQKSVRSAIDNTLENMREYVF